MSLSEGRFETEINDIEFLLRKISFLEERNFYPNQDFDPAIYRNKDYIENWKSLIYDNIFNFVLSDNSILHFKLNKNASKISFQFYECPFDCLSYKDYLAENGLEEEFEDKIFIDYYENYLHQCAKKENPLMIRYDYDSDSYYEGLHPISHLHIGHKNQIRLGTQKIIYPKSFVNFVLRQNYTAHWKMMLKTDSEWKTKYVKEKKSLKNINSAFWNELDDSEFYLS